MARVASRGEAGALPREGAPVSDDRKRDAAIIAAIFPPEATPVPCPRCGRAPILIQDHAVSSYECRPWWRELLGMRPCLAGPRVSEGRSDGEYAVRAAAGAWNRAASRWRRP